MNHPYLLWSPRPKTPLNGLNFQRYVSKTGLHSPILRYSFATHYYNESKDIKLICDLLGHANVLTTSEYPQLDAKEAMDKAFDLFSS